MRQIVVGLSFIVGMGFLFYSTPALAADSGWMTQAFAGSRVSVVTVNPDMPLQVAAVVDNQLKVTWDGGLIWRSSSLPAVARAIVFDPVYPNVIYAGTTTGVYKSLDIGLTWSPFGNAASRALIVSGITANKYGIFSTENNGAGTSLNVFRFDRQGSTSWVAFPDTNAGHLFTDKQTSYIYAASRNAIYRSIDGGYSWSAIGITGQIGFNSLRVYAKGSEVWQLANKGVWYTSNQGTSWQALANNINVPELNISTTYGIGLTANQGNAFFGIRNDSLNIYGSYGAGNGIVPSNMGYITQKPNDLSTGDGALWMATETGLLVRNGLTVNEAAVRRPVVVVPGILGSWQWRGQWLIDPIRGSYNPLLTMLRNAGYSENQTLFTFPYQWRQDNHVSAAQLGEKIAQVRSVCLCAKVDVIGHSMGGLVARAYVQGSNYNNDIENLILLGTPNAGSLNAYSQWEAGVNLDDSLIARLGDLFFHLEAFEHSKTNLTDYIRQYVVSVRQLLPNYSYISDRIYPNGYPPNDFLDALNSAVGLSSLYQRVNVIIAGADGFPTMTQLEVGPESNNKNWPHGEITKLHSGAGDGTVPLSSLVSIGPLDTHITMNHGDLVKRPSSRLLVHLLSGSTQVASSLSADSGLLVLYVKSPVSLYITNPNGDKINDSVNQVPGSFYTGSDETVQFITIPNFTEGQYLIHLIGKGQGEYTVGASVIAVDPSGDLSVEFKHQTVPSQQDELVYDSATNQIKLVSSTGPLAGSGSNMQNDKATGYSSREFLGEDVMAFATDSEAESGGKASGVVQSGQNDFDWRKILLLAMFSVIISGIWALRRTRKTKQ